MCITTVEALYTVKTLIKDDVDACCEASMDKNEVTIKLEKLKKYIEKIDKKENPVDLNNVLDGNPHAWSNHYFQADHVLASYDKRLDNNLLQTLVLSFVPFFYFIDMA